MATIQIRPVAVEAVVHKTAQAAGSVEGASVFEVCLGLAELMGRTIASQREMSPLAMQDFAQTCLTHLENTIRIGVAADGRNMEDIK
jgi:hypothetical protein